VTGISGAALLDGNAVRLLRVPGPAGVEPVTGPWNRRKPVYLRIPGKPGVL